MKKKNSKILIVDDEPEMGEELREILEDEGYLVCIAYNGVEAIEIFSKAPFNLVLLDIKMPKMNGVEAYRKMRQANPDVPIVIVTGSFARKNATQLLREGANDVVYKPFDVGDLLVKMKKFTS